MCTSCDDDDGGSSSSQRPCCFVCAMFISEATKNWKLKGRLLFDKQNKTKQKKSGAILSTRSFFWKGQKIVISSRDRGAALPPPGGKARHFLKLEKD